MNRLFIAVLFAITSACSSNSPLEQAMRFQNELDLIRQQYNYPGIAAYYLFDDGQGSGAYSGFADLESGQVLTSRSRMLGASTGKSFVGALTVLMSMEGRLDLDTPVSDWLGDLEWYDHLPNQEYITLRHLLTHSSGLSDHVYEEAFQHDLKQSLGKKDNQFTVEQLIAYVLDKPPLFSPGEGFSYSDTGYLLIGLVLEKSTGKKYYELINESFIEPLGLSSTLPATQRYFKDLAVGYISDTNVFGLPRRTLDENASLHWHPEIEWTGGGFVTSAKDLAHWGAVLFSGRLIEEDYLSLLSDGVGIEPGSSNTRYGAGVVIKQNGKSGTTYGHSGWVPGYVSSFRYYERLGLTIAVQINTDDMLKSVEDNFFLEIEERLHGAIDND